MPDIPDMRKLEAKLKRMISKAKNSTENGQASVIVGYDRIKARYAIYVHENQEAHHPIGNAKFLANPYRHLLPGAVPYIVKLMKRGYTLPQALLKLGERLKKDSQAQVPVDTGNLKESAYVELEKGYNGGSKGVE